MSEPKEYELHIRVLMDNELTFGGAAIAHTPPSIGVIPPRAGYYVMYYAAMYLLSAIARDAMATPGFSGNAVDSIFASLQSSVAKLVQHPEFTSDDPPANTSAN